MQKEKGAISVGCEDASASQAGATAALFLPTPSLLYFFLFKFS